MPESSASNQAGDDKTDNVDAEHDSDSGPGFAISVDLSACTGAPARCRVWVRRRARKVRWLAGRVRRAAKLRGSLLLLAGDHLLPPGEPLRILRPDDTLRVTRVEHQWQHAFSFADSDQDAPTHPAPTQTTPAVVHPTSPKKTTSEQTRKPKHVPQPTSGVPSLKRKFTVGDTLFLLNQTVEEHTQTTRESETERFSSAERNKPTSEVGHIEKKTITMERELGANEPSSKVGHISKSTITMEQELGANVDYDALDRVKRRALALLEQVTDEKDTDVVDAPKRKRRRVRRRKPAKLHNPEEFVQELNDSEPQKNAIRNPRNHMDLTEQDDSESETKQRLLGPVSNQIQDLSKSQVDDSNISNTNGAVLSSRSPSPVRSASVQSALTPSMQAAQSPPTWVIDYAELPPETQIPVLIRNIAPPRPPRVVRALGSETPRDILE